MRVDFVIGGLRVGGAEWALHRLAVALRARGWDVVVWSLTPGGAVADALAAAGVPARGLDVRGARSAARALRALSRAWRAGRPAAVHAWMAHANLFALLAAGTRVPVVWSLHTSSFAPGLMKASTRLVSRAAGWLSRRPRVIVATSASARRAHVELGYAEERMTVIPNGVDVDAFRPDAAARADVRRALGIPPEAFTAAFVGRWDPMKDPLAVVRAAAALPDGWIVMAGPGMDGRNPALAEAVRRTGAAGRFLLLGERRDVARIWAAADAAVCPSKAESSPLAVLEAMACGLPCVVTDVGDLREMVGDTGLVVPAGDDSALAGALRRAASMGAGARAALGAAARRRAAERYALERTVSLYEDVYRRAAGA